MRQREGEREREKEREREIERERRCKKEKTGLIGGAKLCVVLPVRADVFYFLLQLLESWGLAPRKRE